MKIDEFHSPGELIQQLLETRGWSQRTLGVILNVGEGTITRLLKGRQPLSAELALVLEDILGVRAAQFLSLQNKLDLVNAKQSNPPDPGRAARVRLHGDLPICEMIKRGWLDARDVRDAKRVEAALMRFFSVTRIEDIAVLPGATKKMTVANGATPAQVAWLRRVEQMAGGMPVAGSYCPQAARGAIAQMRASLGSRESAAGVPALLAECGIRFVIVEALSQTRIDGACLWLNDRAPVVGMSLRVDRIDNFWFVLRYELEHILRLHGHGAALLDADLAGDRLDMPNDVVDEDRAANKAAREFCVSSILLDDFIAQKRPSISELDLIEFARVHKVHPGIVAGRIQSTTGRYDGKYSRFRAHFAKVRTIVCANAVSDGWGNVPKVAIRQGRSKAQTPRFEAVVQG